MIGHDNQTNERNSQQWLMIANERTWGTWWNVHLTCNVHLQKWLNWFWVQNKRATLRGTDIDWNTLPWIPWSQKDSFLLFSYSVEILFFYNDNDTCTSQKWHVLANCSEIIGHVQTPIYQNIRACVFVVKSLVKTCKLYW